MGTEHSVPNPGNGKLMEFGPDYGILQMMLSGHQRCGIAVCEWRWIAEGIWADFPTDQTQKLFLPYGLKHFKPSLTDWHIYLSVMICLNSFMVERKECSHMPDSCYTSIGLEFLKFHISIWFMLRATVYSSFTCDEENKNALRVLKAHHFLFSIFGGRIKVTMCLFFNCLC